MDTRQTTGQGCLSEVGCIADNSRNHQSIYILKKKKKMLDKLRNLATGEMGGWIQTKSQKLQECCYPKGSQNKGAVFLSQEQLPLLSFLPLPSVMKG